MDRLPKDIIRMIDGYVRHITSFESTGNFTPKQGAGVQYDVTLRGPMGSSVYVPRYDPIVLRVVQVNMILYNVYLVLQDCNNVLFIGVTIPQASTRIAQIEDTIEVGYYCKVCFQQSSSSGSLHDGKIEYHFRSYIILPNILNITS